MNSKIHNYGRNVMKRIFLEIVTTFFLLEMLTSVIRYSLILNYRQLVNDRNGVLIQHVYQARDLWTAQDLRYLLADLRLTRSIDP